MSNVAATPGGYGYYCQAFAAAKSGYEITMADMNTIVGSSEASYAMALGASDATAAVAATPKTYTLYALSVVSASIPTS